MARHLAPCSECRRPTMVPAWANYREESAPDWPCVRCFTAGDPENVKRVIRNSVEQARRFMRRGAI